MKTITKAKNVVHWGSKFTLEASAGRRVYEVGYAGVFSARKAERAINRRLNGFGTLEPYYNVTVLKVYPDTDSFTVEILWDSTHRPACGNSNTASNS